MHHRGEVGPYRYPISTFSSPLALDCVPFEKYNTSSICIVNLSPKHIRYPVHHGNTAHSKNTPRLEQPLGRACFTRAAALYHGDNANNTCGILCDSLTLSTS
eukprot:IDg7936t1